MGLLRCARVGAPHREHDDEFAVGGHRVVVRHVDQERAALADSDGSDRFEPDPRRDTRRIDDREPDRIAGRIDLGEHPVHQRGGLTDLHDLVALDRPVVGEVDGDGHGLASRREWQLQEERAADDRGSRHDGVDSWRGRCRSVIGDADERDQRDERSSGPARARHVEPERAALDDTSSLIDLDLDLWPLSIEDRQAVADQVDGDEGTADGDVRDHHGHSSRPLDQLVVRCAHIELGGRPAGIERRADHPPSLDLAGGVDRDVGADDERRVRIGQDERLDLDRSLRGMSQRVERDPKDRLFALDELAVGEGQRHRGRVLVVDHGRPRRRRRRRRRRPSDLAERELDGLVAFVHHVVTRGDHHRVLRARRTVRRPSTRGRGRRPA